MHILNNGNGITSKLTWLMNHPYWSLIICLILIGLIMYMLGVAVDNKRSGLAWFSGVALLIYLFSFCAILFNMNDMHNLINDKICFASSNKTLNRVYRASPDIKITSDETAQAQQIGTEPAKQYIYFTNNKNFTGSKKQRIMQITTKFVGKKSTISLKPLNKLGRSYDRVCWYVAKQPNLYDLKIRINNNGTVATYRPKVDSQSKIKVVCFLNKPEKQAKTNIKTVNLSLAR